MPGILNNKIRPILLIGFMLVYSMNTLLPEDTHLIDHTSSPDYSKNINRVGECVLKNELKADTLTVELLLRNMQYSVKPSVEYTYDNDRLKIFFKLPNEQKDSIYFDKAKNKYDTLHIMIMNYSIYGSGLGPQAKKETFRFKGFKKCPEQICLNNDCYLNCAIKDIDFRIFKGDTINRINANGFKQGLWITFYDTGEINEKKMYDNGSLVNGKTYDKKGNDLHYVGEFENGIGSLRIDSLMNK